MDYHPTIERLYQAALELRGVVGQKNVALLIGKTQQNLANWQRIGISSQAAVDVQEIIGCNANWLLTGKGEMMGNTDSLTILQRRALDALALMPEPEQERWALELTKAALPHWEKAIEEKEVTPGHEKTQRRA